MTANNPAEVPSTSQSSSPLPQPSPQGTTEPTAQPSSVVTGSEPVTSPQGEVSTASAANPADATAEAARRRILIGSQRDPAAYRARRQRDWEPVAEPGEEGKEKSEHRPRNRHHRDRGPRPPRADQGSQQPVSQAAPVVMPEESQSPPAAPSVTLPAAPAAEQPLPQELAASVAVPPVAPAQPQGARPPRQDRQRQRPTPPQPPPAPSQFPPPSVRDRLSPDMEDEFAKAMGEGSFEDLMTSGATASEEINLEPESRHTARVIDVRRDDVFVELGGREQGCISLRQFKEPPQPGAMLEVIVHRLNPDDGLYELMLPGATADVGDWEDLNEGMLVEAMVTGHNTGGLECEVNHIRGFIPVSQIALNRVEDLAQFVGQRFTCMVTEANPMRRNLVLSHRAVLEREKEEAREKFRQSLAVGQVFQGTVRKLMDFGAFVDIGGIDGLLHVSQLAWGRVNHPKEVLTEGQTIQVRIEKFDPATGKISLGHRDLLENPWDQAAAKYPPNSVVKAKVTKLMEFGAFAELEPGVEGLIHISELSHKRVWRASDVAHEGDEVEVLVLSVNAEAQRMSLSIKALSRPEPTKKEQEAQQAEEAAPAPSKQKQYSNEPLRGGLGRSAGGDRFGLKW